MDVIEDLILFFRVTEILGYRPIDLLGKLCYEFYSENDVDHMKESFEQGNAQRAICTLQICQPFFFNLLKNLC